MRRERGGEKGERGEVGFIISTHIPQRYHYFFFHILFHHEHRAAATPVVPGVEVCFVY